MYPRRETANKRVYRAIFFRHRVSIYWQRRSRVGCRRSAARRTHTDAGTNAEQEKPRMCTGAAPVTRVTREGPRIRGGDVRLREIRGWLEGVEWSGLWGILLGKMEVASYS